MQSEHYYYYYYYYQRQRTAHVVSRFLLATAPLWLNSAALRTVLFFLTAERLVLLLNITTHTVQACTNHSSPAGCDMLQRRLSIQTRRYSLVACRRRRVGRLVLGVDPHCWLSSIVQKQLVLASCLRCGSIVHATDDVAYCPFSLASHASHS